MKLSTLLFILILGFGLYACISPFQADLPETLDGIVVTATLTTIQGLQEVRLLRPSPYSNSAYNRPFSKAQVWITNNQGQRQDFVEDTKNLGWYLPADRNYAAEVGKTYVLHITTADNKKYESTPETIRAVSRIKTVYTEEIITEDPALGPALTGFSVLLDADDPSSKGDFYRWTWLHYDPIAFCSRYEGTPYGGGDRTLVGLSCCVLPCWDIERCYINCTNILSDALINGKTITRHPIVSIPYCPNDYYLEVQQRSISQAAFDYWRTVDQLSANNGSLFDAAPAAVRGNIKSTSDPEEPVYGFFEVSDVHENGFHINRADAKTRPTALTCAPNPVNANPFACAPCTESIYRTQIKPKFWTK